MPFLMSPVVLRKCYVNIAVVGAISLIARWCKTQKPAESIDGPVFIEPRSFLSSVFYECSLAEIDV